ncbi:MAG: Efflux ABC transporter, permease protein, partial [uncultured Blastococcus sp.]
EHHRRGQNRDFGPSCAGDGCGGGIPAGAHAAAVGRAAPAVPAPPHHRRVRPHGRAAADPHRRAAAGRRRGGGGEQPDQPRRRRHVQRAELHPVRAVRDHRVLPGRRLRAVLRRHRGQRGPVGVTALHPGHAGSADAVPPAEVVRRAAAVGRGAAHPGDGRDRGRGHRVRLRRHPDAGRDHAGPGAGDAPAGGHAGLPRRPPARRRHAGLLVLHGHRRAAGRRRRCGVHDVRVRDPRPGRAAGRDPRLVPDRERVRLDRPAAEPRRLRRPLPRGDPGAGLLGDLHRAGVPALRPPRRHVL